MTELIIKFMSSNSTPYTKSTPHPNLTSGQSERQMIRERVRMRVETEVWTERGMGRWGWVWGKEKLLCAAGVRRLLWRPEGRERHLTHAHTQTLTYTLTHTHTRHNIYFVISIDSIKS